MLPPLSSLGPAEVRLYVRPDEGETDEFLGMLLAAARGFVLSYTALSEEEADIFPDLSLAALVLCSDLYDNRQLTVQSQNVNRAVQSMLDLHCGNLV